MNRRGFLKRIGFTGAAVVVAPAIVFAASEAPVVHCGNGLRAQMEASNTVYYDKFSIEELEQMLITISDGFRPERRWVVYTGKRGREQLRAAEKAALYEYLNQTT